MRRVTLALFLVGCFVTPAWAGPTAETTARLRTLAETRSAVEQMRLARLLLGDIERHGTPVDGPRPLDREDQVAVLRELLVHPSPGVRTLAQDTYADAPFALQREADDKLWRRLLERALDNELAALEELERPEQRRARATALLRPRDGEVPAQRAHRTAYLLRRLLGHTEEELRRFALETAPSLSLPLPVPPELREAAERLAFRSPDAAMQRSLIGLLRGWRVPPWENPLVEWLLDERADALAGNRPARAEEALGLLRRYLLSPAETRREIVEFLATSPRPTARELAGRLHNTDAAAPDPVLRWRPETPQLDTYPRPTVPSLTGSTMPRPRPTELPSLGLGSDPYAPAVLTTPSSRYAMGPESLISGQGGTNGALISGRLVPPRSRCPEHIDREGRAALVSP